MGGVLVIASAAGRGRPVGRSLPSPAAAVPGAAVQGSAEPAGRAGRARIMVIDDDAQVRTATAAMLTELGYEVVEGDSARAGLDHLRSAGTPDLILADQAMPGMTGSELVARMRASVPDLKSLLISGYADNIPEGAGPVLRKPFTLGDLGAAVARVLRPGEIGP